MKADPYVWQFKWQNLEWKQIPFQEACRNTVSMTSEMNFVMSQDGHVSATRINSRRLQGNEFCKELKAKFDRCSNASSASGSKGMRIKASLLSNTQKISIKQDAAVPAVSLPCFLFPHTRDDWKQEGNSSWSSPRQAAGIMQQWKDVIQNKNSLIKALLLSNENRKGVPCWRKRNTDIQAAGLQLQPPSLTLHWRASSSGTNQEAAPRGLPMRAS